MLQQLRPPRLRIALRLARCPSQLYKQSSAARNVEVIDQRYFVSVVAGRSLPRSNRSTKLGTMSAEQIERALYIADTCCRNGDKDGLEMALQTVNQLGLELSSGSYAALQYSKRIADLHRLALSSFADLTLSPAALEQSDRVLRRLVSWYQSDFLFVDPPLEGLINLVTSSLEQDQEEKATEILIWWTTNFPQEDERLSVLFHQVLYHLLESGSDQLSNSLIQRMRDLQSKHNWQQLEPSERENFATAMESTEKNANTEDGSRPHELTILTDKIIDFVKSASTRDAKKVSRYANQLLRIPDFHLTPQVCQAFLDFYANTMKDTKESLNWLQRLDQPGSEALFENHVNVFELLVDDKTDLSTSWRATELFQRIEELEMEGKGRLTTHLYNKFCTAWARTGDPRAITTILATMKIMGDDIEGRSPDVETWGWLLEVAKTDKALIKKALEHLAHKWKHMDLDTQQKVVEKYMRQLATHGMEKEALALLGLTHDSGLAVNTEIASLYVVAWMRSSSYNQTIQVLDKIDENPDKRLMTLERKEQILSQAFQYSRDAGLLDEELEKRFAIPMKTIWGKKVAASPLMSLNPVACTVSLLEKMAENDDFELLSNVFELNLMRFYPQLNNSKQVAKAWIKEAVESGRVLRYKREGSKHERYCLAENAFVMTLEYVREDLDTKSEENFLIAAIRDSGGYMRRCEVNKLLIDNFDSMQSPFARARVLLNAHKKTLVVRKTTQPGRIEQVIGLTDEKARVGLELIISAAHSDETYGTSAQGTILVESSE